jgi:hypothetical protein
MYSALYYPHTKIQDEEILKQALLLWDHIDVITPYDNFKLESDTAEAAQALELVARPRSPSKDEKKAAHDRIVGLANQQLPHWFAFDLSKEDLRYLVWPQKFLPETWEALQNSNLAQQSKNPGDFYDYVLCRWLGLTMMSILAEECAGTRLRLLTDEEDSYSALGRYLAMEYAGTYTQKPSFEAERLVTTSIQSIGLKDIPLEKLVRLRDKEDAFLRGLRRNYLSEVDKVVTALSSAKTESDKKDIEEAFAQAMKDDYQNLSTALGRKAVGTLLSKEMFVAFLSPVGAIIEPWTSSVIGIGALVKARSDYRAGREEVMKKHATSWLYQAKGGFKLK